MLSWRPPWHFQLLSGRLNMPTSRRLFGNTRLAPHGYMLQIINFVALVTVIFLYSLSRFPIYIATESGSFDEVDDLPALFSLDTNIGVLVSLPLHNDDSRSSSRSRIIDVMLGSRTSEDITRVQQPRCPLYPPTLQGVYGVDVKPSSMPDSRLDALTRVVRTGGWWMPPACRARQRLAVIIPYRDRARHLSLLLSYLHPFLQRQMRHYQIFVVEQAYDETFNKGMIMNVAFTEVMRRGRWDCIVFHDVDMVPENDRNIYECMRQPRHLSPGVDVLRYVLMYGDLIGGALALTPTQVVRTNGYSNLYWGWGAEDDDMYMRIKSAGYDITRPPNYIGRYKMVRHKKRKSGASRERLYREWRRWRADGINSLRKWNLTVLGVSQHALYTNITVDVGKPPPSPHQVAVSLALSMRDKPSEA